MNLLSRSGGDAPAGLVYPLALVLAALQIALLFPGSFLAGHGAFFFDGDLAKDVAGWRFYAQDAWRLPLLFTERLNFPQGVSIAFTDSIPLAALLFKPFVTWLPAHFQYMGIWHAVAFAGQAVAATFLIRSLGCRSVLATVAAVLFALNWPVLLLRLGHTALLTQGLLLAALGAYFRAHSGAWTASRAWWLLTILCQVALLIHPYLMAMCYAIACAFLLSEGLRHGDWARQAVRLVATLALTAGLAALCGYFGANLGTGGYGDYRMALEAPFCDDGYTLWPCPKGGGYEAYNYVGFGTLILLFGAITLTRRRLAATLRQHGALVIVLLLLTLFAISHRIHIGPQLWFELPLPAWLHAWASIFQASGRFFWPVGYCLLFAALAGVLRSDRRWAGLFVVIALLTQLYDTHGRRQEFRARVAMPGGDARITPEWAAALAGIRHIAVHPAQGCGEMDASIYLALQTIASRHGATFNTAYTARSGAAACQAKAEAMAHPLPDTLLIAQAGIPISELPPPFTTARDAGLCLHLSTTLGIWGVPHTHQVLACRASPNEPQAAAPWPDGPAFHNHRPIPTDPIQAHS